MLIDRKSKLTKKEKSTFSFKIKSIVATFIAFAFVIVLAISFGQVEGCEGSIDNNLAKVAGSTISTQHPMLSSYVNMLRESDPDMNTSNLIPMALNQVIWDILLLKAAGDNDIIVTPRILLTLLQDYLADQKIARETFAAYPRSYREAVEKSLAEDYMKRILQLDINSTGRVSSVEFNFAERLNNYRASVDLILLDPQNYIVDAAPDTAMLREFFNANQEKYRYLLKASHILVENEADAANIKASISVENFAATAASSSIDQMSAVEGGSLGWFFKDAMIPEFSAAALLLNPGEISNPVKTSFGYHIIFLEEKREYSSFDAVDAAGREKISAAYMQNDAARGVQLAEQRLRDMAAQLQTLVSGGASFAAAARSLGLTPVRTGLFGFMEAPSEAYSMLQNNEDFHINAFALQTGKVSPLINAGGQYVVLSPVVQRQEASRYLDFGMNPEKFENLSEAEKMVFQQQIFQARQEREEKLRRTLFNDWTYAYRETQNVQINWDQLGKLTDQGN